MPIDVLRNTLFTRYAPAFHATGQITGRSIVPLVRLFGLSGIYSGLAIGAVMAHFRPEPNSYVKRITYEVVEGFVAQGLVRGATFLVSRGISLKGCAGFLTQGALLTIGSIAGERVTQLLGSELYTLPVTVTGTLLRMVDVYAFLGPSRMMGRVKIPQIFRTTLHENSGYYRFYTKNGARMTVQYKYWNCPADMVIYWMGTPWILRRKGYQEALLTEALRFGRRNLNLKIGTIKAELTATNGRALRRTGNPADTPLGKIVRKLGFSIAPYNSGTHDLVAHFSTG